MAIFKRIEVWLLVLLSLGGAFWVLKQDREDDITHAVPAVEEAAKPVLVIHRCALQRDYGNARLDIELRYRNDSPRPLILQAPEVRLIAADGQEVPAFVLPMEKPPQIPANTAQDARLRYWLDKNHLKGTLTLDIRGAQAEVKSSAPLDLETLENGKPRQWNGPIR